MIGIEALEGFLPRRLKERHVFIRELVACADELAAPAARTRPLAGGDRDHDIALPRVAAVD